MSESVVVLTYGSSGIGKSTDMGYAFPTGLFAAAPGALKSVASVCGYMPATVEIKTIEEATALIHKVKGKYQTLVIDDFSFLAEQTFAGLEKKHKNFKLWGALRDVTLEFRDTARYAGMNVALNCWEQGAKTNDKGEMTMRGGPMLSGKLPEQIPALCDMTLRGVHDKKRKPWPASYQCQLDSGWVLKDRYDIVTILQSCPMNIGEVLRAAGVSLERHPDIKDQDEVVDGLSVVLEELQGKDLWLAANEIYQKLVGSSMSPQAARWTLRDAMDRAEIRKGLLRAHSMFIDMSNLPLM